MLCIVVDSLVGDAQFGVHVQAFLVLRLWVNCDKSQEGTSTRICERDGKPWLC
jgi:hypothetical protein